MDGGWLARVGKKKEEGGELWLGKKSLFRLRGCEVSSKKGGRRETFSFVLKWGESSTIVRQAEGSFVVT